MMETVGFLVLFLSLQAAVFAEVTFELKNAQVFKGDIVSEDENYVVLDINGAKIRILKGVIALKDREPFGQGAEPVEVNRSQTMDSISAAIPPDTMPIEKSADAKTGVKIIIFDFQTTVLDSTRRRTQSDIFRNNLRESGKFTVVTRDIAAVTGAQPCESGDCMQEAARAAGASVLLSGMISSVDKRKIAASVKIVDIETGQVLYSATETGSDNDNAIVALVKALAAKTIREYQAGVPQPQVSEAIENEKSLSETSLIGSLTDFKKSSRYISVLPFIGDKKDSTILRILENDFRKALTQTGSFDVMERAKMKEILEEQDFQLSDRCDQTTCVAEAGKIIGVSKIITVTVSKTKKNTYAVGARLIDVATAKELTSGTEEREGEMYKVTKRMLENIATVIAGKPNRDHIQYLADTKKLLERQKKRVFISFDGGMYKFINLLQLNNYQQIKKAFGMDTVKQVYSNDKYSKSDYVRNPVSQAPEANVYNEGINPGGLLEIGCKLTSKISIVTNIGLLSSQWGKSEFNANSVFIYQYDSVSHEIGIGTVSRTMWDQWTLVTAGLGIKMFLTQGPYFEWTVNAAPHYTYGTLRQNKQNSDQNISQMYYGTTSANQTPIGLNRANVDVVSKSKLTGNGFGGDVSTKGTYLISSRWSVSLFAAVNLNLIYGLEGTKTTTTRVQEVNFLDVYSDKTTTTTTDVEYVYGHNELYSGTASWFSVKPKEEQWPIAEKKPVERTAVMLGITCDFNF